MKVLTNAYNLFIGLKGDMGDPGPKGENGDPGKKEKKSDRESILISLNNA